MDAFNFNPEQRNRECERKRRERREQGIKPRKEYLANSLTRIEPWKAEGVSRRTWYRRYADRLVPNSDAPVPNLNGPVNVSQVRQLSPFRYPGGKTWCVPEIKQWLSMHPRPTVFVEPFAGGAITGLTVAMERLADQVVLADIDGDVAAVWQTIIYGSEKDFKWFCDQILNFQMSRVTVEKIIHAAPNSLTQQAFRTILKNRVNRGGILAPGASLTKDGENGRGLKSRWYPETLVARLIKIREIRSRLIFRKEDAFGVIARQDAKSTAFFIDPPYTASEKCAGSRLYNYSLFNHEHLFKTMSQLEGSFLATYDDDKHVRQLSKKYELKFNTVQMKSTHHAMHYELLITKGAT